MTAMNSRVLIAAVALTVACSAEFGPPVPPIGPTYAAQIERQPRDQAVILRIRMQLPFGYALWPNAAPYETLLWKRRERDPRIRIIVGDSPADPLYLGRETTCVNVEHQLPFPDGVMRTCLDGSGSVQRWIHVGPDSVRCIVDGDRMSAPARLREAWALCGSVRVERRELTLTPSHDVHVTVATSHVRVSLPERYQLFRGGYESDGPDVARWARVFEADPLIAVGTVPPRTKPSPAAPCMEADYATIVQRFDRDDRSTFVCAELRTPGQYFVVTFLRDGTRVLRCLVRRNLRASQVDDARRICDSVTLER